MNTDGWGLSGEWQIHELASVASTQAYALRLLSEGETRVIVTAEHQTNGAGRDGRTWVDVGRGQLLMSIGIADPQLSVTDTPLPQLVASAVEQALRSCVRTDARERVKHTAPNDLFLDDSKCGGVLIDARTEGQTMTHLVIGIGVNVNACPTVDGVAVASLRDVLHSDLTVQSVAARVAQQIATAVFGLR